MNKIQSNDSLNILIVDDDIVDREMIKRHLEKSDLSFNITECSSVDEGLAIFDNNKIDIVLLDYRMPQRDGIEMILELKTHMRSYGSAIVMMSSAEDEKLATDCLEAGAQDFIPKSEVTTRRIKNALLHAQTRFKLEKELRDSYLKSKELAEKDSLTGLANRFVFEESLQVAIANNVRNEFKLGLLLFDIDFFKKINDIHGHAVGDEVLKKVAEKVSSCLRGDELFSRLGGDEFSIMVTNLKSGYQLGAIANRVLNNFYEPLTIDGLKLKIEISMGMAIHPDNSIDSKELIKCSDIAMYRSKTHQGNHASFFYDEMQTEFLRRYQIEQSLTNAIKENRFHLVYQPIINPNNNTLLGFETLLRLRSSKNELIPPDEFIPIAEQSGVICDIGEWVLFNALKQFRKWQLNSSKNISMSINLSPVQLNSEKLLISIEKALDTYKINPADIEFEITETALLNINDTTLNRINHIKKLGFRLALDDFGTGYSSISHLAILPIDTVKLDKSIMPSSENKRSSTKLVNAISNLANSLHLDLVAEGIEDKFQCELIIKNNIMRAQGYLFCRPMRANDIDERYF